MRHFWILFLCILFPFSAMADFDARSALAEVRAESVRILESGMAEDEKRLHLDALDRHAKRLQKIIRREQLDNEAAARRKDASQPLAKTPSPPKKEPRPTLVANDETAKTSALLKFGGFAWRAIQSVVLWGAVLGMVAAVVMGILDSLKAGRAFFVRLFRRRTPPTHPSRPEQIGRAFGEGLFSNGMPSKECPPSTMPIRKRLEKSKIVPRDGVVPVDLR